MNKQQLADVTFQVLYLLLIHNPLVKEARAFHAVNVTQKSSFYELEDSPVIVNMRWFMAAGMSMGFINPDSGAQLGALIFDSVDRVWPSGNICQ